MKTDSHTPLLQWFTHIVTILAFFGIGCSIMVGNIKPLEQKSQNYGVINLSEVNPDWIRLNSEESSTDPNLLKEPHSTEISDIAYQTKKTSSIISLNSACRPSIELERKDLKAMTQVLFMGISELNVQSQRNIQVQGISALESTVQGKLHGEAMKLKTVVFYRGNCVYDLVYMARPHFFDENEKDFAHFVDSIRLK
jgi:hypothetical protein